MTRWRCLPVLEADDDIVAPVVNGPVRICALHQFPKIDSATNRQDPLVNRAGRQMSRQRMELSKLVILRPSLWFARAHPSEGFKN